MFEEENPNITVEGTYDSSGKLQTQIEEGIEADVFMSAAMMQMNALVDEDLVDKDSVVKLLENKIVLIGLCRFCPGSAGIYGYYESRINCYWRPGKCSGRAVFTGSADISWYLGRSVSKSESWYECNRSVELGCRGKCGGRDCLCYRCKQTTDKVKVVAEAPEGSLAEKAIYPVGVVSASAQKEAAEKFVDFLQSDKAIAVFEKYGFIQNK